MEYTKGKWESGNKGKQLFIIWQEDVGIIADVSVINPEWLANANLIAAAPNMYEALKQVLDHIEASAENQDLLMTIGKALNKAEGIK